MNITPETAEVLVSFLSAFLLPQIIDIIRAKFGVVDHRKAWVLAFGASFLVATCVDVLNGLVAPNLESIIINFAVIFATSQGFFKQYWEDSEPRQELLDRVK